MIDRPDDYFDWIDDSMKGLSGWCMRHWRATLVAVGGAPVLIGVALGFGLGKLL